MLYDPEGLLSQIPEEYRIRGERKRHEEKLAVFHGMWRYTSYGVLTTAIGDYDAWCASLGVEVLTEKMFTRLLFQWQTELSMQAAARTAGQSSVHFRRGT